MRIIKCECGQDIKVDDHMFELLNIHKWYHRKGTIYRIDQTYINMTSEIIIVPPGTEVDHKDRDIHNMQGDNLRPATHVQNSYNKGKYKNNQSGFLGVRWCQDSWGYKVTKDGKIYRRQGFSTPEEAAHARDKKAKELFGEFASLNFP